MTNAPRDIKHSHHGCQVLHRTLATEVRQENAHLDTVADVAALADDIQAVPPA